MMPIDDDGASLQLILDQLRSIDTRLQSQDAAAAQDRQMLHDMNLRLDRIERNQLERKVRELEQEVDSLKSDRDQRVGATKAAEWLSRFGPSIILLVASVVAAVVFFRGH